MPVRQRITILFALLVMLILGVICGGIYYFSYTARRNTIKSRLLNRAITTGRLLSQKELFDQALVRRIDSLTTISLKNKLVQAFDESGNRIYNYNDAKESSITIDPEIIHNAVLLGVVYFTIFNKEAVAYHYRDNNSSIIVVSAGEDVDGKVALQSLFQILLISFLVGIAIVVVTGYFFSYRLLQPVRKITSDVEEISAQNLARRIKTGRVKDEWQQLATTLNDLLNRLQESFELQRRFISNASHELSTPLTSISSQLEVSLQRDREAKDYKLVMQSIYNDVRNMSKLTQTLLEFAKASGNAGGLEINLLRIDEILLRLPAEMAKANTNYTVKLEFTSPPENEEDLLLFGNEVLLFTAIKNIVQNACKYSEDQQATVTLEILNREVRVTVTDKGKGIEARELQTIFQPFYRMESNRSNDGFGLGLSLADRIIKLHKGTIEVKSTINQGTSFSIILPSANALK